jgi:hypothetical protein
LVNAAAEDLPRAQHRDVIDKAVDDYSAANAALRNELDLPALDGQRVERGESDLGGGHGVGSVVGGRWNALPYGP